MFQYFTFGPKSRCSILNIWFYDLQETRATLNEADSSRKKLQVENQDLQRQMEETENAIAALGKNKISLTTQLEDTKRMGDAEARDRASLLSEFKNMNTELEN